MAIYLKELEGKQIKIKKGTSIPLYKEPLLSGTPDRATKLVRNAKNEVVRVELFYHYKDPKKNNGRNTVVTIGKLVQYNGVNYYTTSQGYLIPASSKWFDISSEMKTGVIKTTEVRKKEAVEQKKEEEKTSWYNILVDKAVVLGTFAVGAIILINISKNSNNKSNAK